MANKKISELTAGAPLLTTDRVIIVRSGNNFSLLGTDMTASATAAQANAQAAFTTANSATVTATNVGINAQAAFDKANTVAPNTQVIVITGSRDFANTDDGRTLTYASGSSANLTLQANLVSMFSAVIIQLGAGQVIFSANTGTTLNNASGFSKTGGANSISAIIPFDNHKYLLTGGAA